MTLKELKDDLNNLLTATHVRIVVDMPGGTQKVTIENNIGLGPTIQFYILLQALATVLREFKDELNPEEIEGFIDTSLKMVKNEILESESEEK